MLEFEQITQITLVFLGFCVGLIIDILWWVVPAFKKAEKGFEAFEHFHISQFLFIGFLIVGFLLNSDYSLILFGGAIAFFLAEWSQSKEIKGKKVIPGAPFAYGSTHFKSSAIIGVILFAATAIIWITLYFYLGNI